MGVAAGDAGLAQKSPQGRCHVPGAAGGPRRRGRCGRGGQAPPPPLPSPPPPALAAPRLAPRAGFLVKMAALGAAQAWKLLRDLSLRSPLLAARSQVSGPLGGSLEQPVVSSCPCLSTSSWPRCAAARAPHLWRGRAVLRPGRTRDPSIPPPAPLQVSGVLGGAGNDSPGHPGVRVTQLSVVADVGYPSAAEGAWRCTRRCRQVNEKSLGLGFGVLGCYYVDRKKMHGLKVGKYILLEASLRAVSWGSFWLALRNCSKEVREEPGYMGVLAEKKPKKKNL